MGGDCPPFETYCTRVNYDDRDDGLKEDDSYTNAPLEDPENIIDFGEESFNNCDEKILKTGDKVSIAHLLLKKSKKCAAKYLKLECIQNQEQLKENMLPDMVLSELIAILINPDTSICNGDSIKWIKWLISSGETPKAFYKTIEQFDNPVTCSFVWTSDCMAYRCRTCGIALCMALCMECFHKGNHIGHDYYMFKSQTGGVCDCGNPAVMKKSGFCSLHKGTDSSDSLEPLDNLLLLARAILPQLILRFLLHCREHGNFDIKLVQKSMANTEPLISFLQELCCKGSALKKIVTDTFCTPKIYKEYTAVKNGAKYFDKLKNWEATYLEALSVVPFDEVPGGCEDLAKLNGPLVHNTFLEEFLFWTVKFEFPRELVSLLLKMKIDSTYEDALAKTFVQHYSRIAVMLIHSNNTDALSQRVVYVSVQLFSDNNLAYRMTYSYHLLHVMILSLKKMISTICMQSTLHDIEKNKHQVADCRHAVMRNLCFWPLVSDLKYILSFKNIADIFLSDARLLREWILILSLFQVPIKLPSMTVFANALDVGFLDSDCAHFLSQANDNGMNNNIREITNHIEYEPQFYYAAFSAELKGVASPLGSITAQLKSHDTKDYSMTLLKECLSSLSQWFSDIGFFHPDLKVYNQVSFHLPLHRCFAIVLQQAMKSQDVKLCDALPSTNMLSMMLVHPLRVQVAFHEIFNNLWVRNGLQIKGQAMAYVQSLSCNSMVDPDIFILQLGAGERPKDSFCLSIFEMFHSLDPLCFSKPLSFQRKKQSPCGSFDMDTKIAMLESCLTFLALIATNRHSIGLEDEEIIQLELMVIICMGDKTHSQIMDLVPEKCLSCPSVDFEAVLKKVTKYCKPECAISGSMKQGTYVSQAHVWEDLFDPIFAQLRSPLKKDYQILLNRFKQYCKDHKNISKRKASRLWPPYRLPSPVNDRFVDPRRILSCRTFQTILYVLLYKCLYECGFSENLLSLAVYLLELTIDYQSELKTDKYAGDELTEPSSWLLKDDSKTDCPDGLFYQWYSSDNVFLNSTVQFDRVELKTLECPERLGEEQLMKSSQLPLQISESDDKKYVNPADCNETKATTEYNLKFTVSEIIPVERDREVVASGLSISPTLALSPKKELVHSNSTDDEPSNLRRTGSVPSLDMENKYLVLGESLISILIKLHTKLTGGKAYKPNFQEDSIDSRIGDGPFFITKVLNKLGSQNHKAKCIILETMNSIFPDGEEDCPTSSEDESSSNIMEDKRMKARELQKKVMASFARKQKQFMDQNYTSEIEDKIEDLCMKVDVQKVKPTIKLYDCVICNQHVPSSDERPIGLIVFIQSSNLAGQRTASSSSYNVPTSDRARTKLRHQRYTLGQYMREKAEALNNHFNPYSCYNSMDIGWEGGVYVQTCGHHIHLDCQSSYLLSLRAQETRHSSFDYTKNEFLCPLCQQISNSVIPISSNIEETFQFIKMNSQNGDYVADIDLALKDLLLPNYGYKFISYASALENTLMEKTTIEFPKSGGTSSDPEIPHVSSPFLFLFVSSIFRTNIEMELIQLGGSLFNVDERSSFSERSSLIPLLRILAFFAKFLSAEDPTKQEGMIGSDWMHHVWSSLTQTPVMDSKGSGATHEKEVPMLCRDPVSMLIHFVLLLPPVVDQDYFQCIIYYIYRLVVVRACVSSLRSLPKNQREKVITNGPLAPLLALAYDNLRDSQFFYEDDQASSQIEDKQWSINEFTCEVREICLEFLRIASILKSRMTEESLPQIADPLAECGALERHLGLWESCSVVNTAVMGKMCGIFISDNCRPSADNGTTFSGMPVETQLGQLSGVTRIWCNQFESFASRSQVAAAKIMLHVKFYQPRLLCLPPKFEDIFQYYHQKRCSQCGNVPKDPALCLVCGTVVSLKQSCCKVNDTFETILHARECGANIAVFLVISQSTILVVHGTRIGIWGCVHLDSYGEEDQDLQRGKPLFLSTRRYQCLEQQWLHQMFDLT